MTADPRSPYRTDPVTGFEVVVVQARQGRPNRPASGCPFCVGGVESPERYTVRAFPNRWPSLPDGRCEVVLYSPDHEASLATVGAAGIRPVVDLWAERTAVLGARDDVAYVHVFENHGAEVGATIAHPHGQVYAYDRVPERPARVLRRLADGHPLLEDDPDGSRVVAEHGGWRAWVPYGAAHPHHVRVAPLERVPDLPSLEDDARDGLAGLLADLLPRFDHRYAHPMPYMLWWVQRPADGARWPGAWLHLEIAGVWRADGVAHFIAGAEAGTGSYLNPLDPDEAAAGLRAAAPPAAPG